MYNFISGQQFCTLYGLRLTLCVSKAKETFDEGIEKAKKELKEMDVDEKIADVKEDIQEGIDKAKEVLGDGLDVVQKQFAELKKRFNL